MRTIPFVKYTSFGNNFVIVDEITSPMLTEGEKSTFAYHATNQNFGVGADNFVVVQSFRSLTLAQINEHRRYWEQTPQGDGVDFIFRMFEPDGNEAYSCANGLMCVMKYLHQIYDHPSVSIMTEIPTATPKVVTAGIEAETNRIWINLGAPSRISDDIVNPQAKSPFAHHFDKTIDQIIQFRKHDLEPIYSGQTIALSGYLVFTGEPHLVILTDEGFPVKPLADLFFIKSDCFSDGPSTKEEKRSGIGTWLVQHIGHHFNFKLRGLFPKGVNVNFVRINESRDAIEYRCYERGIYKETLSCGTGALACAFVAHQLGWVENNAIPVFPHRCRWYDPSAQMLVRKEEAGWTLHSDPNMLFLGELLFQEWPGNRYIDIHSTHLSFRDAQADVELYHYN